MFRRTGLSLVFLLVVIPLRAADSGKLPLYVENEIFWKPARSLASSFATMPLPTQGPPQHAFLVSGQAASPLGDAIDVIKSGYQAGLPVVIVAPAPESQSILDDITGGDVDLPNGVTSRPAFIGEPRLEAFAFRRPAGSATADVGEFWVAFDADDGPAAEERAEDDRLIASIAEWLREKPVVAPAPPTRVPAAKKMALKSDGGDKGGRASIDDLTSAVVRKVTLAFDQGSMATVVKSWAAYSPGQNEDWYIFELTTTSQPLNFATYSAGGMFSDWEKGDSNCRGIAKTACARKRYATKVQVKLQPKTPGLELMFYGPDSDREQDEYSYSSKFSLGGKVTAGFDEKGPKAGVELSGGAEFTRSTKVTIKDATLVGISNTSTELAGWRFDMPQMRAVNDLTAYGGPSMSCDNLLQMPYPVQRGSMESRQYAIYRLPTAKRAGLAGIDMAVSLSLEESTSWLQNWTAPKFCNIFNCNCAPESYVAGTHELNNSVISFPLAAHGSN